MKESDALRLERKIIIGMIIDTDFLKYVSEMIETQWILSQEARLLATWIYDYYSKYGTAPKKKIQDIYFDKLANDKISEAQGEVIEDILEDLSNEVKDWDPEDVGYLQEQAKDYANYCKMLGITEEVQDLLDSGDLNDAKSVLTDYRPVEIIKISAVEPLKTDEQLKAAFAGRAVPLIKYPGDLGMLLNPHMVKQGFVVYLAQNKGGKSFHLMDAGMRAAEQGRKVLMYQAGDMSQEQLELRMAIYATQISDQERYCGPLYIPIIDCQNNQLDSCEENCRVDPDQEALFESGYNFFENDLTNSLLQETYDDNRSWKVCTECRSRPQIKRRRKFKGTVWFKKRSSVTPLDPYEYKRMRKRALKDKFYTPFKGFKNLRLGTHSSDTLTMGKVRAETGMLADKEGWKAEVVIADYLDLFGPDSKYAHLQFRDQENKKWAAGRRFSQDLDLLFISASQSDAQGFNKMLLDKSNFSEDRRKLDHVTAMIGINMTNEEKMLGLMRLNEVTTRETEGTYIVNVLHRLQIGRPILNSYF